MEDYVNDYEQAWEDYQEMGPLWADMVFGDDFEAMQAMYGGNENDAKKNGKNSKNQNQSGKRR